MLFSAGYFRPGYTRPAYFGAATLTPAPTGISYFKPGYFAIVGGSGGGTTIVVPGASARVNVLPNLVKWLVAAMSADATLAALVNDADTGRLRIYEAQDSEMRFYSGSLPAYPDNPRFPLICIDFLTCPHSTGNGGRRFASHPTMLIFAVADGEDMYGLRTLANRIEALFGQRARGQMDTLIVQGSVTVEDYALTMTGDSGVYKRLGAIFQFFCYEQT